MVTTYNIDRNTASRLLDVSVRTVDRYLKSNRLSSAKSDGRIWLSKEEILDLLRNKDSGRQTQGNDTRRTHVEPDIIVDNGVNLSNQESYRQDTQYRQAPEQQHPQRQTTHVDMEELYQELREEIAIKEKRLAQASYKLGQLEAQIASMVPMLEFEKQQKLLAASNEEYEKKLAEYSSWLDQKEEEKQHLNMLIKQLDEDLHMEKVNKWVYAVILYVLVMGFILIWVALKFI